MSLSSDRTVKLLVAIFIAFCAAGTPEIEAQDPNDEIQVSTDGKIGEWAIGSGGSRLAIRSAERFELSVVDVAQGKIVGKAPAVFPNEPCVLSADEDSFYVLCPKGRELRRYDLATLRELAVTEFPGVDAEPVAVSSGLSAKSDVAVAFISERSGKPSEAFTQLLDRETLLPQGGEAPRRTKAELSPPLTGYASANGASIVFYMPAGNACEVLTRNGEEWNSDEFSSMSTSFEDRMLLTDDGRRVISPWGVRELLPPKGAMPDWTPHPIPPERRRARYFPLPAFGAAGSLAASYDSEKLRLSYPFERGVSASGTVGFGFVPEGEHDETHVARSFDLYNGVWASKVPASRLELRKRFFYSNGAKRLVAIPFSDDRVVLRKFDAESIPAPSPNGPLLAKSKPPSLDFFSSRGEVRISIDGKIGEWGLGAGGARLCLRSAGGFDLVLVDVTNGTVLAQSPPAFPNESCVLSADEDSVYVLCPKAKELRRYDLETLRELAVTMFPGIEERPVCVVSGASSKEPVAVAFAGQPRRSPRQAFVQFLNRETLRPYLDQKPRPLKSTLSTSTCGVASADGRSIVLYAPADGYPVEIVSRDRDGWTSEPLHGKFSDDLLLSDDGQRLISAEGTRDLSRSADGTPPRTIPRAEPPDDRRERLFPLPAFGVSGSLAASFQSENLKGSKPGDATVVTPSRVTVGYVPEGGYVASHESIDFDFYGGANPNEIGREPRDWRKRVFYSDRAKRIVVIPLSNELAVLRKFDVEDPGESPGANCSGPASVASVTDDEIQIRVAGRIGEWTVGAGGSRIAVRDAARSMVSVIDVATGTVLCSGPPAFPGETCVLSADEDSLYVLCPRTRELKRFHLDTLREVASTSFPKIDEQPVSVASGMSATGEIAVAFDVKPETNARKQAIIRILGRDTLRPRPDEEPLPLLADLRVPVLSQASADGGTLVFYSETGGSCLSTTREGDRWTSERCRDAFAQSMYLSEDGKRVVTDFGTRALRNADDLEAPFRKHPIPYDTPRSVAFPLPAYGVRGSLAAAFDTDDLKRSTPGMSGARMGPVRIGFVPEGQYFPKQVARGFDLYGPDGGSSSADRISIKRRIFYAHRAERIVVIPFSNDRVILRKFVAQEDRATAGDDPPATDGALVESLYPGPKEEVQVAIEGKIGTWAVGAGGSLLAVRSAARFDLRVVDVAEGKVRAASPPIFPDQACVLTADEDSLYVLCPSAGELRKFDLDTLTERAFTQFPGIDARPFSVVSGPSGKQNIAVAFVRTKARAPAEASVQMLDRETLRPYLDEGPRRTESEIRGSVVTRASANGEVLLFDSTNACELLTREGERWVNRRYRAGLGEEAMVSDDGLRVIHRRGSSEVRYLPDGSAPPLHAHRMPSQGYRACAFPLPAYGVPGTLSASFQSDDLKTSQPGMANQRTVGPVQIGFVPQGEFIPKYVARDFDLFFGVSAAESTAPRVPITRRIYYSDRAKSIVVVPYSNDRVVLRKYVVSHVAEPPPATDWPELPETTRLAEEKLAERRRLEGEGAARIFRCSPDDETVAFTSERKLLRFASDGCTVASAISLPYDYDRIGVRGDYLVAVGGPRRKIDVLQASDGKLLRSVELPSDECYDLAMHPTRPLSYVSYRDEGNPSKSSILVFDELAGSIVQSDSPIPGRSLDLAPNSSKLLVGAEIVSDVTVRAVTLGRFRPIVTEFKPKVRLALDYDLFDPERPVAERAAVVEGAVDRALCSPDSSAVAFLANRPNRTLQLLRTTNLESPPGIGLDGIGYQLRADNLGTDVAWHPTLDVVAALYGGAVGVYPSYDSPEAKAMAKELAPGLTLDLRNELAERLWFSRDGRNLVVLGQDEKGSFLRVFPVKRPTNPSSWLGRGTVRSSRVPLAHVDALRGGSGKPMTIREIAAKFAPSTVVVRSGGSRGTGFVVSSRGYALTCAHLLEPGEKVSVLFVDPDRPGVAAASVAATVVDQDHELDVALLRYEPALNRSPARLSTALQPAAGESVTVIGNPGVGPDLLEQTVTTGVVSSPSRTFGERKLIQVSAAINPGSSGGAAFDDRGRVIGMVTRKGVIEGAGFAVPAAELTDFLLRCAYVDDDSLALERTWVERSSGRELVAAIVSIDDSAVTVRDAKRDRSFEIPFERLSQDDVRFIEAILALRQSRAQGR